VPGAPAGPLVRVGATRVRGRVAAPVERTVPEEVPVALVYDGTTHAVMLASPADLEDFAVGFSLTERRIAAPADIAELEIVAHETGIEARMWLAPAPGRAVLDRHRALLGPTGCGLCGVDSLAAALPAVPRVGDGPHLSVAEVEAAVAALRPAQVLNAEARALHAVGLWRPGGVGLVAVREDVGRHNALDKLAGALARSGEEAAGGVLVLSSRLSVELVQKAAVLGVSIVVAVSAPTALALRTAEAAGMTVIGIAREDGFEVFTGERRIALDADERTPWHAAG
jgi:FdhD protein